MSYTISPCTISAMSVQLFLFLCVFVLAGMTKGSWGDSCELNDNCESCELIHNINDRVKCSGNLSALNNAHRKSGRMLDRSPPPHAATLQRPSCYSPSSNATPPPLAYRGSRSHFILSKVVTMCVYPIGSVCRLRMCLSLAACLSVHQPCGSESGERCRLSNLCLF